MCPHGHIMKCSYFDSIFSNVPSKSCVIYLHGNSSSRLESYQILDSILPLNLSLLAFDFPGCGLSEGDWVSLGFYENGTASERTADLILKYLDNDCLSDSIGIIKDMDLR